MTSVSRGALVLAGAIALTVGPAWATVRIGQEAVARRYPAANCSYCHTFDSDHMRQRARDVGLQMRRLECNLCHGAALRTGRRILNERGAWLRARRIRLKAPRADAGWLVDYERAQPAAP